jgi:Fe-S cluster assembly scaffold protein SufB
MKLTKEVVEKISSIKGEPKWMLDFRLRSLDAFLKSNNPNFGPKLDIDYDNITYYKERENNLTDNWNNFTNCNSSPSRSRHNIHCTCSTSSFFNPFFMRNI